MELPARPRLERLRVLLVEDAQFAYELVASILTSVGITRIRRERDGSAALASLPTFGPHIAIVDWEMEPMNGLDFVRAVRALPERKNPYLPIIMLTSHAEAAYVVRARDAGVHEYLAKPFTGADLLMRLAAVLNAPRPFVRTPTYFGPAIRSSPNVETGAAGDA
jgi:DNA-binding response OmpR family regulator